MQTSLIPNAHGDLVTDAAYDFYGVRLATCSLDHRIKIWQLDESDGTWTAVADWKVCSLLVFLATVHVTMYVSRLTMQR
jgi:hypothetical protein